MLRRIVWPWLMCIPLAIVGAGCGGTGLSTVPVSGTVAYEDGSALQAQMASVTFQPTGEGSKTKGASGQIKADGTFQLTTIAPNDGALPGDYRVTFSIGNGYPNLVSVVAPEYTTVHRTPVTAKVEAGKKNHFDFKVKKP